MRNLSVAISFILVAFGCNNNAAKLQEKIANADSIAVNYFKGDGSMDTVTAVKIIRDKKSTEELVGFIASSSSSAKSNCGYDGSIHFFKNDRVVQDVFFNSSKAECRQFYFVLNGRAAATALADNAKEFLLSLKNK